MSNASDAQIEGHPCSQGGGGPVVGTESEHTHITPSVGVWRRGVPEPISFARSFPRGTNMD